MGAAVSGAMVAGALVAASAPAAAGGVASAPSAACYAWEPRTDLQAAVRAHSCVQVPAGTHVLSRPLLLPGGTVLQGDPAADRDDVVLKARRDAAWALTSALVETTEPYDRPAVLRGLTVDGGSRRDHRLQGSRLPDGAVIGISTPGMVVHDVVVQNARCNGVSVFGSRVTGHALTTWISSTEIRGNGFECALESAPPGAGIYVHPVEPTTDRVVLVDLHVHSNDGPGIDIDRVDDGVLASSRITGNGVHDGWAGVSLVDGSGWLVSGNTVEQVDRRGKRDCPGWPAGEGSAALFLCARKRLVTNNVIVGNDLRSRYPLLLSRATGTAAGNVIADNVVTSTRGPRCGEGNPVGANTWRGNSCLTGARVGDEPPAYFRAGQ